MYMLIKRLRDGTFIFSARNLDRPRDEDRLLLSVGWIMLRIMLC